MQTVDLRAYDQECDGVEQLDSDMARGDFLPVAVLERVHLHAALSCLRLPDERAA